MIKKLPASAGSKLVWMEKTVLKKEIINYLLIAIGSLVYAFAIVFFIFPNSLLLGGTAGLSVIIHAYIPFSSGTILTVINVLLLVVAFIVLGKSMAIKTLVGSLLTTAFVALAERIFNLNAPVIGNDYLSVTVGAVLVAIASGIMFYVGSSSGGTDIIALIVRKYSRINIGIALLITDIIIVIVGGLLSGKEIFFASAIGFLIKVFGIDGVIALVRKIKGEKKNAC